MKRYILSTIILLFIFNANGLFAQNRTIKGIVYGIGADGKKTELPLASIFWAELNQGKSADNKGRFSINVPANTKDLRLVASYIGYQNDTLTIIEDAQEVEFVLLEGMMLAEAVVTHHQRGSYISKLAPRLTEIISKAGLQKMACCNLAESFENSATVTVGFTDAVSGAKQIQMLGLSGIYTQMLDENIPTLRGLASTYGWSYTPGTWMEAIQVSKGTSSVINGYESTTGQINLEFKKPNNTEDLFINLYGATDARMEANVTGAVKVADKLWTGLLVHGSIDPREHDSNDDYFMDIPKTKLFNIYNRWVYENPEKQVESRTGFKFLYETRDGGQVKNPHNPGSGGNPLAMGPRYTTNIVNKNFNVYNKTGFAIGNKEGKSIGLINSFTYHEQNSEFGAKAYDGKQLSYYGNALLSSYFGTTTHSYTVGASFAYDQYDDFYSDTLNVNGPAIPRTGMYRQEIVPGAFAQYTYSYLEKFMFIVGFRGDYNSRYSTLLTPRANVKYSITEDIVFRASAGRGYRSPNVIAENIGLMASSRHYNIGSIEALDIEKAWNYGASMMFYIPLYEDHKMSIGVDYYRTNFDNQVIVDMEYQAEQGQRQIYFYNLKGKSYANAWQIDANLTPFKGFDIYAAFRVNDTKITYSKDGREYKVDKPLMSQYRGLLNLSYATDFEKWKFDITAQINGPTRLPDGYNTNNKSSSFPLFFAQVTKKTRRLDIYVGCENIFNYKQKDPIVDYSNPFGKDFDSSRIWGPLMGFKAYAGIRLRIGEIK
ncbi:MAG: TonB-dependent receptor [Prevotellaceae bacterium]|jgi:outer membrane receptor for ferrienterochelin and colicin|nr:TonB-dependent receptor [Prevotellaceae bacterium]